MKKMNNKGFSLVELIIVMAIMAVLIGVMAPAYSKYVEQAKKSRDVSAIDTMMTAAESVLIDLDARLGGNPTIVLEYDAANSKIVIDEASTDNAETELALIVGDGAVVAGTWKEGTEAVTGGTLTATISNGFVDFAIGSEDKNFFEAVADYSSALAGRME